MDGASVDVSRVVSGLAVFVSMTSGTATLVVSADGTVFTPWPVDLADDMVIVLPPCQAIQIVDLVSGVPASLQWNGVVR